MARWSASIPWCCRGRRASASPSRSRRSTRSSCSCARRGIETRAPECRSVLGRPRRGARGCRQLIRLTHPLIALDATLVGCELAVDVPDVLGGPLGDLPEVEHAHAMEPAFQHLRHTLDLRQIVRLAAPGVRQEIAAAFANRRLRCRRILQTRLQRAEPLEHGTEAPTLGTAHGSTPVDPRSRTPTAARTCTPPSTRPATR